MKELLLARKTRFIIYIIACFIPVFNQLIGNYAMALLIGSATGGSLIVFWRTLIMSLLLMASTSAFFILSRMMRIGFIRDIILDVRRLAFDKIQNLSYEAFASKSKAIYLSHLINDINLFEENFFLKLINVIFRGGSYIVTLVILAFYDLPFAIGILITSIIVFIVVKTLEGKTVKMQERISNANGDFTVDVSNTFDGLSLLKLNRVENAFLSKNLASIDNLERQKMRYQVFTEGQRNITRLLSSLIFIGILMYGLSLLNQGISVTQMTFMIVLANGCIWPLEQLIPLYNELKGSLKIFDKIAQIDSTRISHSEGTEKFVFNKELVLENVSFSFNQKSVFSHVNLKLERGKKYLLKGSSGSGKSTLIKLLSQTYHDYDGDIYYDDVPLRKFASESYNNHVAFIYQDVFLFEDTIHNNIALYRPTESDVMKKAIKLAGLEDFVYQHPEGLNRELQQNGQDLSGGQRQRIAIARALVKEVDIIFSDEATSSLNPELGAQVEQTLLDLPCTLIAVSHRYYPGVTEQYDEVIEIKNGKINMYPIRDYFQEEAIA